MLPTSLSQQPLYVLLRHPGWLTLFLHKPPQTILRSHMSSAHFSFIWCLNLRSGMNRFLSKGLGNSEPSCWFDSPKVCTDQIVSAGFCHTPNLTPNSQVCIFSCVVTTYLCIFSYILTIHLSSILCNCLTGSCSLLCLLGTLWRATRVCVSFYTHVGTSFY